jgi:hypothetical protein
MRAGVSKIKSLIRAKRSDGATLQAIADEFGVHVNTVQRYCKGVKPRYPVQQCLYCGCEFSPHREGQVFHSQQCETENRRWRAQHREYHNYQQYVAAQE